MSLKDKYHKFLEWQKNPFEYKDNVPGEHICNNCGNTFVGNNCPICGQKASDGPVTWRSVWTGFVQMWGIESRSLPASLLQLLLRPGYFIGDFIGGRRQISFPPINMLFIVTVIYALIKKFFGITDMAETVSAGEGHEVFRKVVVWLYENPAWTMMIMTMIVILPTWILFKHSPRNANHTLPQSVFIQIFMSTLMIVIVFLIRITTSWLLPLIPIYYFFAYRQLFGFGVWGTIWRITLCFLVWVFFILAVAFMIVAPTESDLTIGTTIRMSLIILLPAVVIIAAGVVFNIVKSRKL